MGATKADAIRSFCIHVPEEDLVDLRRRLAATRWPTKELVKDRSQGVQLATLMACAWPQRRDGSYCMQRVRWYWRVKWDHLKTPSDVWPDFLVRQVLH